MILRELSLLRSSSFFLFGARGTGKTTYLREFFKEEDKLLWIDLLEPSKEIEYLKRPEKLIDDVRAIQDLKWVVIDEVQKVPSILNVVHKIIEESNIKFALTGSSARKLKHGGANLLAGRAFSYNLYPFTYSELGDDFQLEHAMRYGALPLVYKYDSEIEKKKFLESYCMKYLKEEVFLEQLVRKTDGFRIFIEIAARENANSINYSNIAKDVGLDPKTIATYYEILEDTLVSFKLNFYSKSIRKQQLQQPKFYFFDCGVLRYLKGTFDNKLIEGTYEYGKLFETFIIQELIKRNSYLNKSFRLSYLRTNNDLEIDLIVERPGRKDLFVEIKSSRFVDKLKINQFKRFAASEKQFDYICVYNGHDQSMIDNIRVLPWQIALNEIFSGD